MAQVASVLRAGGAPAGPTGAQLVRLGRVWIWRSTDVAAFVDATTCEQFAPAPPSRMPGPVAPPQAP